MKKDCCSTNTETGCNVNVTVDVAKIIRYLCIAAVLIIAIIFGTKCYTSILTTTKKDN